MSERHRRLLARDTDFEAACGCRAFHTLVQSEGIAAARAIELGNRLRHGHVNCLKS